MIDVLRGLLAQLDRGRAHVAADEVWRWSPWTLAALEASGILSRGETAWGLVCDHCEEGCWVEPKVAQPRDRPILVHPCVGGADAGLLRFGPDRLNTWRISADAVARLVHDRLSLVGRVEERIDGRLWALGDWRRGRTRRAVFLGVGLGEDDVERITEELNVEVRPALLVAGAGCADRDVPMLRLADVITADDGEIGVDEERVAHWLGAERKKAAPVVAPFTVPEGAAWGSLVIDVLDDERARLRFGKRAETRSYIELGMADGRARPTEPRPDSAWALLKLFADNNGEINWKTPGASDKLRDRMRDLRKKLAAVVPIEGNPIADYSDERAYKAAFIIRRLP